MPDNRKRRSMRAEEQRHRFSLEPEVTHVIDKEVGTRTELHGLASILVIFLVKTPPSVLSRALSVTMLAEAVIAAMRVDMTCPPMTGPLGGI